MGSLLMTERYLPHQGGSRRYYHELAKRIPDCSVLTGHEPGEREFDRSAGVRILRRAGVGMDYARPWYRTRSAALNVLLILAPRWAATFLWGFWESIRRRPQVIHAGGYLFPGVAARLLRRILGVPYLVYAHGEEIAAARNSRRFQGVLLGTCLEAERVVANSENTAAMLRQLRVPAERIVVARPGVDAARCLPRDGNARARLGVAGGPVLLSLGRLARHKGFSTVIEALPPLASRWPGIVHLVAGVGGEEANLRRLASELGVADRVRFLGLLNDQTLPDAFAAADLFVQPNGEVNGTSEGYGMVYLEAGAAGLAVIGGRSGGVVEAVVDGVTGFLVTPWNVPEVVERVDQLLSDPALRHRMGEAGRALSMERTWDATLRPAIEADAALRRSRSRGRVAG